MSLASVGGMRTTGRKEGSLAENGSDGLEFDPVWTGGSKCDTRLWLMPLWAVREPRKRQPEIDSTALDGREEHRIGQTTHLLAIQYWVDTGTWDSCSYQAPVPTKDCRRNSWKRSTRKQVRAHNSARLALRYHGQRKDIK